MDDPIYVTVSTPTTGSNKDNSKSIVIDQPTTTTVAIQQPAVHKPLPTSPTVEADYEAPSAVKTIVTPFTPSTTTHTAPTTTTTATTKIDPLDKTHPGEGSGKAPPAFVIATQTAEKQARVPASVVTSPTSGEKQPPASVATTQNTKPATATTTTTTTATTTTTGGPPVWMQSNGDPTMLQHEAMVGKLVQKNLNKASQFEAKASKLTEKAAATSTYPIDQVNKYTEKAASEELKAEQYRAGALLTAQESSVPGGGVFPGVPKQTMDKVQGQGMGMGQGPPPPMQSSHVSSDVSNTASSNVGKGNVMLSGRPAPVSSPPSPPSATSAATSTVATVASTTTNIPIVPLSGGGSAPGLGASQAGRMSGPDASKQGLASSVMQSNKPPLPGILMDGNNENKQAQATLMETSLKVGYPNGPHHLILNNI